MNQSELDLLNAYIIAVRIVINQFTQSASKEYKELINKKETNLINTWTSFLKGKAAKDNFTRALNEWKDLVISARAEKKRKPRELTRKQFKFVEAFVQHHNGAKAARLAGYSAKVAKQIGYDLLRKPVINKAIQHAAIKKLGLG